MLAAGHPYWLHVGIVACLYAILAASWSLLAGHAGQFSFAHMAFATIGAYTSGLVSMHTGAPIVDGIAAGTALAALAGLAVGVLCLRLRGVVLALFTVAFSEVLRLVLNAEVALTGGPNGLALPALFATTSRLPVAYLALGLAVLALAGMGALSRSRFGLFLHALRDDETAAAANAVDTTRARVVVFVVTAAVAGFTGAVMGHYLGLVTPGMTGLGQMSLVIAMAVLGGMDSLVGAALGAVVVQVALELGQGLGEWRMVAFGLLVMLTLRFAGDGLFVAAARRARRVAPPPAAAQVASGPRGPA